MWICYVRCLHSQRDCRFTWVWICLAWKHLSNLQHFDASCSFGLRKANFLGPDDNSEAHAFTLANFILQDVDVRCCGLSAPSLSTHHNLPVCCAPYPEKQRAMCRTSWKLGSGMSFEGQSPSDAWHNGTPSRLAEWLLNPLLYCCHGIIELFLPSFWLSES